MKAPEEEGKVQLFDDDDDEEEDEQYGEVDDDTDTARPKETFVVEEEGELESEAYIRQLRCRRFFVAKNITKELEGEMKVACVW